MQIELLDTFLDLIETRNFNKTAERLGVTQSTVSSRIRSLETILEKQLFIRGKSGTEPTVAGVAFADHAKAVKLKWMDARREIEAVGKFDRLVRIGFHLELYKRVLEPWLEWVRIKMPNLAIYVEIDYSNQMILDLTTGGLDLAVIYIPQHLPDIHYEQIGEEKFVMVSTVTDELAGIAPADYILANYSRLFKQAHKQMLPELEDSPISIGHSGAIEHLLRRKGGTAFVSEMAAGQLCEEGVVRPVHDAPTISQPIYSAVHVRYRHSHTHLRLLKALKLGGGAPS